MRRKNADRGSLQTQLIRTYSLLILTGFGLLALFTGIQITTAAWRGFKNSLIYAATNTAHDLERTIESYYLGELDDPALASIITEYEERNDLELSFYPVEDPQLAGGQGKGEGQGFGRGAPETILQPPLPAETRGLREFESLADGEASVFARPDPENRRWLFYTAVPITSGPHIIGYLHYAVHASEILFVILRSWLPLLGGVILITVGVIYASRRVSASIVRPLEELSRSSGQIAAGDLQARAQIAGPQEIVSLAASFNRMAERVEAMIEEQRAFASNASHELRTPLTALRLRTEAIRDDSTLDEETKRRYLTEIDDEVRRMGALIEDLILLSRFDAGRAEKGSETVDMRRFTQSMIQQVARRLEEKSITLTVETPDTDDLIITASLTHVTVVFRNVLENAIKYTPERGSIHWRMTSSKDMLSSTITDSGQGIDPAVLPHVSERFFRGEKSHSREIPGSGLGLSLVGSIIRVYGGSFQIESDGLDQGTKVTIDWPLTKDLP